VAFRLTGILVEKLAISLKREPGNLGIFGIIWSELIGTLGTQNATRNGNPAILYSLA
jgi:hypothetical protein